jgi:DNA-binding NarL/FixJ family response regulator
MVLGAPSSLLDLEPDLCVVGSAPDGDSALRQVVNLVPDVLLTDIVVRNQPEGTTAAKTPKSGRGRRVPLPAALVPALRRFARRRQRLPSRAPAWRHG